MNDFFENKLNLPKQAAIYASFSVIVLLAFGLGVIMPNALEMAELDRKIDEAKIEIEKQKLMVPLFLELTKGVKENAMSAVTEEGPKKLPQAMIPDIGGVFEAVAAKTGVTLISAKPNPDSLGRERRLSVRMAAAGELTALREFLAALGRLPYLEKIEKIELGRGEQEAELAVVVWTALE